MTVQIVGTVDNEDDAKEIKFMAKMMVVGLRAQELGKEAKQIDYFIDDIINMYQPNGGEK